MSLLIKPASVLDRPLPGLYEGWQEPGEIDLTTWTKEDPATGAVWLPAYFGVNLTGRVAPNANETARLRSNQRWVASGRGFTVNQIARRFILEFEIIVSMIASLQHLDETLCFLGLTTGQNDNRGSNNIMGWGISALRFESITDYLGAERAYTGFGDDPNNWNLLRLEITPWRARFFINRQLVAVHTTSFPYGPFYLNFFLDTNAGGASLVYLGAIRAWHDDIII